jgi:hypothetical protein
VRWLPGNAAARDKVRPRRASAALVQARSGRLRLAAVSRADGIRSKVESVRFSHLRQLADVLDVRTSERRDWPIRTLITIAEAVRHGLKAVPYKAVP